MKHIETMKQAIKRIAEWNKHPILQEPDEADELLVNLGLDPQAYRTDGGAINYLKVKAAMRHPTEYATKREHITDGNPCWCTTDDDLEDACPDSSTPMSLGGAFVVYGRSVEAKLKEKNT